MGVRGPIQPRVLPHRKRPRTLVSMLAPALVPEPLWGLSAARKLTRGQWQSIRTAQLSSSHSTCLHCGLRQEKGLVCHEVWDYDDATGEATLKGFQIACRDCTGVHHIGRAGALGFREQALAHMAIVNGMSVDEAERLADSAYVLWRSRSARSWICRVNKTLLEEHPELVIIEGLSGSPGDGRLRLDRGEIR